MIWYRRIVSYNLENNIYAYNIKAMPKFVTVLIDDEHRKSGFFDGLGELEQATKLFMYHTYGLMVQNHKLKSLMVSSDGLILMTDCSNLSNTIIDRVTDITIDMPDKPIMIIIEKMVKFELKFDPCKLFDNVTNVPHRKAFMIDQTERIVKWEYDPPRSWFNGQLRTYRSLMPILPYSERPTSESIKINELVHQFESCSVPLNIWDHYSKLRLIHYSLLIYGYDRTIDPKGWLCTHWKNHEVSIGHTDLWNYSITRFWVTMVAVTNKKYKYRTFKEMYNKILNLHNGALYKEYYSDGRIHTEDAKINWVPPDLKKIE
jgi:hypothetical protein